MEPHGQHSDLVNYLYQRLNELNASDLSRPNVVILRGPAGTGKMQIVQDLFDRLRSSRLDSYWPELTNTDHGPVPSGGGITPPVEGPGAFTWPDNTLPTFSWWGLSCEPREHGGTFDIITAVGPQLSAHMPAYLLAYGRQAGLKYAFTDDIGTTVREVRNAALNEDDDAALTKLEELGVIESVPFIGTLTNWGVQGFQQAEKINDNRPHLAPRDLAEMILSVTHPGFPAVVVVEDMHRTGPDLCSLVDALTSLPVSRPVVVIGTASPGASTDGHFSTWLTSATRAGRAEVRDLVGQPEADVTALWAAAKNDGQNYHFAGAIEKVRHALALVSDQTTEQAMSMRHRLGEWLAKSGQPDKAIDQFEALLVDMIRELGPDHPDTLTTRNDLAERVGKTGQTQEAIDQLEALLEDRTRILGPDHPDTLTTREDLAATIGETGRLQEAISQYESLLADATRALGTDHPVTLTVRSNRAYYLSDAGRVQEAISEHEALLRDGNRVLGPDHPDTLTVRSNRAYYLSDAGRVQEAVGEYGALLADRTRVLGPDHPHTLTTRRKLEFWRNKLD